MIPYFLLIAVPLLAMGLNNKCRITMEGKTLGRPRTLCIDLFMFQFMLLLALRGLKCGTDTHQYLRLFNEYSNASFSSIFFTYQHELGYKLLNKFVGILGGNYQSLLCVTAIMCVCPLWYFYKRESENQMLTIALFLTVAPFMMYFSGIRQAFAISLGIPAWYAARRKKVVQFVAIVLFAMQFHTSAFMLFLIYPLYHAKITKKWLWFVVPCIIVVYVFRTTIFNLVLTMLWKDYHATEATGATTVLILLILFGVYSYIIPEESAMDNDTIAMRNLLLVAVVIQIFAMLHPLSMRMNYYFLIFIPILIPKIAKQRKKQYAQVAKLSTFVMTAYFIYYFLNNVIRDNDDLSIFPYIPFWAE